MDPLEVSVFKMYRFSNLCLTLKAYFHSHFKNRKKKNMSPFLFLLLSLFQNVEDHVAFVITVPTALAIFLAVFVLVCIESIFKKLLRVFSLVIWACLVAMGYLFMFSGGIVCPWDQVRHISVFIG